MRSAKACSWSSPEATSVQGGGTSPVEAAGTAAALCLPGLPEAGRTDGAGGGPSRYKRVPGSQVPHLSRSYQPKNRLGWASHPHRRTKFASQTLTSAQQVGVGWQAPAPFKAGTGSAPVCTQPSAGGYSGGKQSTEVWVC